MFKYVVLGRSVARACGARDKKVKNGSHNSVRWEGQGVKNGAPTLWGEKDKE